MPTDYKAVRDRFQTGDCVLTKGNGLISRIIRLWTEYSHAYIVVRPERYKGLEDRVFMLEAMQTGVRMVLLSDILKKYRGRIDLFKPAGKTPEIEKEIVINSFVAAASQIKYDFGGLFANVLRRTSVTIDSYFCSELVWVKWLKAGLISMNSYNLTMQGVIGLTHGKGPRPGDIPKWVHGELINKIRWRS